MTSSVPRARPSCAQGLLALGGAALAIAVAGCSGSGGSPASPSSPSPSVNRSGAAVQAAHVASHGLRITGGYVPKPASPDVAAAYLTIANATDAPVRLSKVVTSVTTSVLAMGEADHGGVGSMTELSRVDIPAHGTYRFVPDHAHLMLEHPTALAAGEKVRMTLTFTGVGAVTIMLPVVPLGTTPMSMPG